MQAAEVVEVGPGVRAVTGVAAADLAGARSAPRLARGRRADPARGDDTSTEVDDRMAAETPEHAGDGSSGPSQMHAVATRGRCGGVPRMRHPRAAEGRRRRTCRATGHQNRSLSRHFVAIRTTVVLRGVLSNPPTRLASLLDRECTRLRHDDGADLD